MRAPRLPELLQDRAGRGGRGGARQPQPAEGRLGVAGERRGSGKGPFSSFPTTDKREQSCKGWGPCTPPCTTLCQVRAGTWEGG